MLPLPVPLGDAVTLGLWVDDAETLCDGVFVPVKLDDSVPEGVTVVEGLDDDDAVALCVKLGVPVAEGERDAEGVPLGVGVRL